MITSTRDFIFEELKRILSNVRSIAVMLAFVVFMSLVPAFILAYNLPEIPVSRSVTMDLVIQAFIRVYFFTYSISMALFIVYAVSMDIFISDKKEKALEVLLAGPLSLRTLWLAKSTALFIFSYPASLVTTFLFIISVNLFLGRGLVYLPDFLMWLYGTTVLPVIVFFITSLAGILQMAFKRFSTVNFLLFLVAFVLMGAPSFLLNSLGGINENLFFWVYAGIAIILLLLNAWAQQILLNKERIILSS